RQQSFQRLELLLGALDHPTTGRRIGRLGLGQCRIGLLAPAQTQQSLGAARPEPVDLVGLELGRLLPRRFELMIADLQHSRSRARRKHAVRQRLIAAFSLSCWILARVMSGSRYSRFLISSKTSAFRLWRGLPFEPFGLPETPGWNTILFPIDCS